VKRFLRLAFALGVARVSGALERFADNEAKEILGSDAFCSDGVIAYAHVCQAGCDGHGTIGAEWCSCGGPGVEWPEVGKDVSILEALADSRGELA
jgi:hypothetical protein